MEMRLEHKAVALAIKRYQRLGWQVSDVSRLGSEHSGYDLLLEQGNVTKRVEVKGCSALYGIPDLYGSEVDPASMELIADEICVVYIIPGLRGHKIAIVPRTALSGLLIPKLGYRISGRFKNARNMNHLLEDGEE